MSGTERVVQGVMSESPENKQLSPPSIVVWSLAAVAAALAAGWWRLLPAGDDALLASLFFAGATWWVLRPAEGAGVRRAGWPGAVLTLFAVVGLIISRGVTVTDFWFLRLVGPVIFLAAAVGLCGPGALRKSWPGWVALVVWHFWPPWTDYISESAGITINGLTARVASALLWYSGHESHVEGAFIWLPHGRVEVMRPCTAIPLVGALVHTLVPAALALRLTGRRTVVIFALLIPLAFVVSAVRCAWLALISGQPERFAYWHGDVGGSIFTAVALVVLGLIALGGARLPHGVSAAPRPAPQAVRLAAFTLVVGTIAALFFTRAPAVADHVVPTWQAPRDWPVRVLRVESIPAEQRTGQRPIADLAEWRVETPAGQARVLLGYIPNFVGADAHEFIFFQGLDNAEVRNGRLAVAPEGPEAWQARGARGRWWATSFASDGSSQASATTWLSRLRSQWWDPSRWWTLGRAHGPLRDKRVLWMAICWPPQSGWNDPAADRIAAELLASGAVAAQRLLN